MQDETSRASLSMMIPRDQTVSSWYTWPLPHIVYRRQDTAHARHIAADVKGGGRVDEGRAGVSGCPGRRVLGSEAGGVGGGRRGRRPRWGRDARSAGQRVAAGGVGGRWVGGERAGGRRLGSGAGPVQRPGRVTGRPGR